MSNKKNIYYLLFTLVICIFFGIGTYPQLKVGDYKPHLLWARELAEIGFLNLPHILFQQLVVMVRAILPFNLFIKIFPECKSIIDLKSYDISGFLLAIVFYLSTAWILFNRFNKKWKAGLSNKDSIISLITSFVALIVCPIILLSLKSRLILGYIPANVLHNPTYVILRPFALLLFFYLVDHYTTFSSKRDLLIVAILMCMATLSKPNFTISIIPAFAIINLLHAKKKDHKNWPLFFAMAIPAGIILTIQYFVMSSNEVGNKLIFAPFKAILYYADSFGNVLLFLLLSLAFPLSILILYWKRTVKDFTFQLAWLNFLVGLFTFYLLAEDVYLSSLNFLWGPMLGVFILFVQSMLYFGDELYVLKNAGQKIRIREVYLSVILFLHLVSGFVYFFATILHPGPVI